MKRTMNKLPFGLLYYVLIVIIGNTTAVVNCEQEITDDNNSSAVVEVSSSWATSLWTNKKIVAITTSMVGATALLLSDASGTATATGGIISSIPPPRPPDAMLIQVFDGDLESDMEAMARGSIEFSEHTMKHVTDNAAAQAFMRSIFSRMSNTDYPSCNTFLTHNSIYYDISLESFATDYGKDIGMISGHKRSSGGIWMGFSKNSDGQGITVNHFGPFGSTTAKAGEHLDCKKSTCTSISGDDLIAHRQEC